MTPEDETRITKLVSDSAAQRSAAAQVKGIKLQDATDVALPKRLRQMGRLAEPALVRVKNVAKDPTVRSEAAFLLAQIQAATDKNLPKQ